MIYQSGSLVKARGRDWTVLPGSDAVRLFVRPLGAGPAEDSVLLPALEDVRTSGFAPPSPEQATDNQHCRWLREALRLSNRSSAGPFRSFARLGFDPHAYQLVPLLLALRQDPLRLLIADDVGIGKTIEACMIAREMLDRGDIDRFWVLTPPHLAQQWQQELRDKFHIEADVVLPGTIGRLEREALPGESVFNRPFLVISLDFAKRDTHRDAVIAHAPDLIIVDEAHTCSLGDDSGSVRHQRHRLIRDLSKAAERHLVLVTATPHSGKGGAFRSLLGLLDPKFAELPDELGDSERQQLARHYVQRRRADVRADAKFPERDEADLHYRLTPEYQKLYNDVIELARETIETPGTEREQRILWWSALSMLRALASSPRAAAATLEARSGLSDVELLPDIDAAGIELLSDDDDAGDSGERPDLTPGSDYSALLQGGSSMAARFASLAKKARALEGKHDPKLAGAIRQIEELLEAGFAPVVFCRFINTAEYLAEHLRLRFKDSVEVRPVTGKLPPEARAEQVAELGAARDAGRKAVLVATDCLSEGINLQQHFNAVLHYDLAWNPTRHEQREGRVDRFGQEHDTVRIRTYYGIDNRIDGLVLDVLLKKHRQIRADLKVAIPVPANMIEVQQAILEGLLLRGKGHDSNQPALPGFSSPTIERIQREWSRISEEEGRSRSIFAQSAIPLAELQAVLQSARRVTGAEADVRRFVREALTAHSAFVSGDEPTKVRLAGLDENLRDRLGLEPDEQELRLGFKMPVAEGVKYISRTDPLVQGLSEYILDTALDPELDAQAGRCGAVFTSAVERSTLVLLCRFRFNLLVRRSGTTRTLLCEDTGLLAFDLGSAEPLPRERGEELLDAPPTRAIPPELRRSWIEDALKLLPQLEPSLRAEAELRAEDLREQHERVRSAATRGRAGQLGAISVLQDVEALSPIDVVGLYVYLPGGASV